MLNIGDLEVEQKKEGKEKLNSSSWKENQGGD